MKQIMKMRKKLKIFKEICNRFIDHIFSQNNSSEEQSDAVQKLQGIIQSHAGLEGNELFQDLQSEIQKKMAERYEREKLYLL